MNGTSFRSDIRFWLRQGNTINHLLFWNIVVFLLLGVVHVAGWISPATGFIPTFLYEQLSLHSALPALISKPWGLFTYMFTHVAIFHLFFNMLNLYWFGNLFRSFLGNHRVLPLYLLGGITGGLIFLLVYNLAYSSIDGTLIGASASVICMLVACATKIPNYEIGLLFFGPVRLKWLALAVVVLDAIAIPDGNTGGIAAHLGGALMGFVYIKLLDNGTDICQPLIWLFNRRVRVESPRRKRIFKPKKSPLKIVRNGPEENRQNHLDQLLDKINDKGYESLTPEEKAWLKKMSQE
ncbi:Membrane associated serine protease, rhomboid family [Chitinophaga sp. CF118]|uniref:rhomboid family protein n=1 Tax=Chitinophaga sp. CF118 TaxID=1884367 RepID=UPI0008EF12ED|nr:rhomboid family intramembrane serine protease [Chitinophaga sp. CF118]SFD06618.1 Membrane associated serine protease, rhomboid family [Chitinophaga sp. CF118]